MHQSVDTSGVSNRMSAGLAPTLLRMYKHAALVWETFPPDIISYVLIRRRNTMFPFSSLKLEIASVHVVALSSPVLLIPLPMERSRFLTVKRCMCKR
jgi:hypothetical protein